MNKKNRVSQLTLELYYRGLATRKERKQAEKALKTDIEAQSRYKAIEESEREARRLYSEELRRLNMQETPIAAAPRKKRIVAGFVLAAAILLCAIIPAILYLKSSGSNKENAVAAGSTVGSAEETAVDAPEETGLTEAIPIEDTPSPEPPASVRAGSNEMAGTAESPRREPKAAVEQELRTESGGTEIAAIPAPDTGVHMRGGSYEEPPNINIPPGISFILENMFANRDLAFVIIPSRISSIAKNAFAGNPLLSVTIGANVTVDDNAIPGNFAKAYNNYDKAAGTYKRPDTNSEAWKKK